MQSNDKDYGWEDLSDAAHRQHLNGRLLDAEQLYTAAMLMAKRARNRISASVAQLHLHIGDIHCTRGEFAKAEASYRYALAEYENMEGDNLIDICIALKRISETCRLQSKSRQASNLAGRSKRLLSTKLKFLEKAFMQKSSEESA